MAAGEIHVGDVGTVFTYTFKDGTTVVDLTGSTAYVVWTKPDGVAATHTLTVSSPTTGVGTYTTVGGDLDQAGTWQEQFKADYTIQLWHSDISTFTVHGNLG